MSPPAVTRELAELAAARPVPELPASARRAAAAAVREVARRAVRGSDAPGVAAAARALGALEPPEEATVLGSGARTSIVSAALLNGFAAGADESAPDGAAGGIAAAVVPAALAVAEWRGAPGEEVLAAVAVGLEVAARVRAGLGDQPSARGWTPAGPVAQLGAAAAAGRALGLDGEHLALALGIASVQPGGLEAGRGTPVGALAPGRAAAAGVEAALLAERGFSAPAGAIEGRRGLAHVIAREFDAAAMVAELGERWTIAEGGDGDASLPAARDIIRGASADG